MRFAELWETLLPLGRDAVTGGYRRYSFTPADLALRGLFASAAAQRGMRASTDRTGNLWSWWDAPGDLGGQAAGPGSASAGPGARLGGPGAGFGGVGRGVGGGGGDVVRGAP